MVVRAYIILTSAVLLGVVERLNAGPLPLSIHALRDGDLLSVTDLSESARSLISPPPRAEHFPGFDFVLPVVQTVLPVRGGEVAGVVKIPPLPGSAELFLSALLGMGAWHLARQSRDIRFGPWAEWYQTGEPVQVRHMVAFDMNFMATPLHAMYVAAKPMKRWGVRPDPKRSRIPSEPSGSVIGPRAPPSGPIQHI